MPAERPTQQTLTSATRAASAALFAHGQSRGEPPLPRFAARKSRSYVFASGLYLNFWPPSVASYIKPPFATVKIAIPLRYSPTVDASFFPALAPAEVPVLPALAEAPAVIATAEACALNSQSAPVNSSNERLSSKKMIWLKAWAPSCKPAVSCVIEVSPTYLPPWYTRPLPCAPPIPIPPLP